MASTMQVLADRATHPDALVVAGEVADLRIHSGALSLRASKLMHLLVRGAGADACKQMRHTALVAELNEAFHMTLAEFIETGRQLASTSVELRYTNERGRAAVKVGPMLADLEREVDDVGADGSAVVAWEFSPVMRVLLSTSNHWATLSRKAVLAFEGRYSLRLYEMVSLRGGLQFKRKERFDLDDLRRRLGIGAGVYERWIHLKQRALDPAVAEVNHLTGLRVRYEPVKTGRKVTAIDLFWTEVDADGRDAAARELEASRVGRKARRDGTAEPIAAPEVEETIEFPRFGSIRYTAFEAIAKASLPSPQRDIDAVAQDFVTWCQPKGIPLKGDHVTETFAGFCRGQKPAS